MFCILFNAPVNGQRFIERISLIPQVGLSKSILYCSKSPFSDLSYKMNSIDNIQFGLLVDFKLTDKFHAVTGLTLAKRGGRGIYEEYIESGNTIDSKYKEIEIQNAYATVPIFIRSNWGRKRVQYFFDFGLYSSLLTDSFIKSFSHDYTSSDGVIVSERVERYTETDEDFTKNFDFGFLGGIGIEYKINDRVFMQIKIQASVGLLKVDGKYSNDTIVITGTSGPVILELDYFDISSYSKNLAFSSDLGLRFRLSN